MFTVNRSSLNGKYFIMDNRLNNQGKPIGQVGQYYDTPKEATIRMLLYHKPNIYSMSSKEYIEHVSKL